MSAAPQTRQGIWLCIAAMACFAALDSTSKYVIALAPLAVAIWVRFLVQTLAAGAFILPLRGRSVFQTRHPGLQLLRGGLAVTSSALGFLALQTLAVAEFTAIIMLIPMLITLLSALHFKEPVPLKIWLLLAGGLAGALLVIRPGAGHFQWGMLLSLGVVVINAVFQMLTSYLSRDDDPRAMHFYTGLVATILVSCALPFVAVWPTGVALWTMLLLIGLFSTVGHFFMILAYGRARPGVLTPYLYFQIAFATLLGWLVFSNTPDRWSLIGIAVITVCGLASSWVSIRRGPEVLNGETVFFKPAHGPTATP